MFFQTNEFFKTFQCSTANLKFCATLRSLRRRSVKNIRHLICVHMYIIHDTVYTFRCDLSLWIKINTLWNCKKKKRKNCDFKNYIKIGEKICELGYAFDYFAKQIIGENFDVVFIVLQLVLPGNILTLKKLF